MLSIGRSSVVRAAPDQVSADLEGEAAILNTTTGVYWGLDEVGAAIWRLVGEPVSVARLTERLVDEFQVDPAACEADLIPFLAELAEAGLLEVAPPD